MFDLKNLGSITDVRTGQVWTSEEFLREIAVRKSRLESIGVKHFDRVIIAHGGRPAFFADLFACWSLGACAVCVNPLLTRGELATVVDFVQSRTVLIDRENPAPTEGLNVSVIDSGEGEYFTKDISVELALGSNDPALILFTSGTTGDPKGVVHTGGSLAARIGNNCRYLDDSTLHRTLCVLPTHFGHGLIGNCLTPLLSPGNLHLFSVPGIQGTARLGDVLSDYEITFMSSVPAFWKVALKVAKQPAKNTLKQISIGSAPLSAELWSSVVSWSGASSVNNMYGITETANWAAGASSSQYEMEDGLVGKMWGGEVAVSGDDGVLNSTGEGELVLKTPSLMVGYYKRQDLTSTVLKDGWYYTGDRGSIDAERVIRLQGRLKTEINRAGTKVLPEEVDLLLEKHPAIGEACTFGVPDQINGEMVAVAIRPVIDDITTAELKNWCKERIRPDCIPERWYFVSEIPKTDRGKVNRAMVRDTCLNEEGVK